MERSLFPSPTTSFKIHPNKDQSSDSWGLHRAGCELSPLGPLCGLVSVEDFFFSPSGGPTAATLSSASWLLWKQVSRGLCFSPFLNEE